MKKGMLDPFSFWMGVSAAIIGHIIWKVIEVIGGGE